MFFIDVNTTKSPIVQRISFKCKTYIITIRQYADLNTFEKKKFPYREDSFIVHVDGPDIDIKAQWYIGNDLQWHSDENNVHPHFIELIGKMIDHHFL